MTASPTAEVRISDAVAVAVADIELYLALGWQLPGAATATPLDEDVRMVPPSYEKAPAE